MKNTLHIEAKTEMRIRKPAAQVYEAFVDPAITTKFWFTKSSGRLEPGANVRWDWELYDVFVNVTVKALEPGQRILIEWSSPGEEPTNVEWVFTSRADSTTFVTIRNYGFKGELEEVAQQAIASTEGFTFVLAGLKALLEHNVRLRLIEDRHPDGLAQASAASPSSKRA
ncbi:MAG TPA: SRPBCC family protein [Gemmatimonadaceae bacterium]|jgi:uncharacterized protein YndB with AHSA1/START domain|nr:SRPBCC family protein [Gemmatimonadaceae bacterium]